ncbi:hypothetical protein Hanom_Chr04g00332801 [Helianthus anomalus]
MGYNLNWCEEEFCENKTLGPEKIEKRFLCRQQVSPVFTHSLSREYVQMLLLHTLFTTLRFVTFYYILPSSQHFCFVLRPVVEKNNAPIMGHYSTRVISVSMGRYCKSGLVGIIPNYCKSGVVGIIPNMPLLILKKKKQ